MAREGEVSRSRVMLAVGLNWHDTKVTVALLLLSHLAEERLPPQRKIFPGSKKSMRKHYNKGTLRITENGRLLLMLYRELLSLIAPCELYVPRLTIKESEHASYELHDAAQRQND